jgi:hypothetical protein
VTATTTDRVILAGDLPTPATTRRRWQLHLGPPGWTLVILVLLGAIIRGIACLAIWPVAVTLSDAATYARDAAGGALVDPQHPAGYPALVALVGLITRDVAAMVVLQHVLGIAAALLLFAAVRRVAGSPWPALLPAAAVLLDSDEIFLEHNIMSEGPFLFILAAATYFAVRAVQASERSRCRWAVAAGAAVAIAIVFRSAAVFAIPVLGIGIALGRSPDSAGRWRASASFTAVAAVLLAGYAFVNLETAGRFEIAPTPGWHLYARVGRFADCNDFTPPSGTAALCERTPPAYRWGPDFYLYAPDSLARRQFGRIGSHDSEVGSFAVQAILHQPLAMARAVWVDMRRYFVPSTRPHGWYTGWDIHPQLDWSRQGGAAYTRDMLTGMTTFFHPFVPRRSPALVAFMSSYEQWFGFGATLVTVCTLLTILGLVTGPRRYRIGALMFGVAGLAQLLGPTVAVLYMGRYTVPVAGFLAAGAAIGAASLLGVAHRRRLGWRRQHRSDAPAELP